MTQPADSHISRTVLRPLQAFLHTEAASGTLLLASALAAMLWANLDPTGYAATFDLQLALGAVSDNATFTLRNLIDDGLMTIFFLVVGMEIKRELVGGELDTFAKALLPAIAALGGMVVPALIFLAFAHGTAAQNGWGIPMATDIAFCVGILALLGDRVPRALVVFVTALAIFDDIGGILVIALFYGRGLHVTWLFVAAAVTLVLFGLNRARVVSGMAYALAGLALWYALHHSGIHSTMAGVILGLMIPARSQHPAGEVHMLQVCVAFLIMPLFALANSGVSLGGIGSETLRSPAVLGTALGLFVGKPLGIFTWTLCAATLGVSTLPRAASKSTLFGASVLSGVGFTVALFIANLAFQNDQELLAQAKLGIVVGSLCAGVGGFVVLQLCDRAKAFE